jgi:cobalamin biosynthesis Mg chelatase CobN
MSGTRQGPVLRRGRSILALSTLALLAFCCLPALVQADSAGIEYSDAPPTSPSGKHTIQTKEPSGHSSNTGGGSGSNDRNGGSGGNKSAGGDSSAGKGADATKGDTGQRQGSQGKAQNGGSKDSQASAEPISSQSEDDGSSPLAAILIAIAILAAITIGAVAMRQRRRGDDAEPGAPAAPKAS